MAGKGKDVSASGFAGFGATGIEARRYARQPMLLAARLILVTGERAIHIRDLSVGGARIAGEDLLALLYRQQEKQAIRRPPQVDWRAAVRAAGGGLAGWLTLPRLWRRGDLRLAPGGRFELTDQGREQAQSLVRSHRLWEAYLDENFALPRDHLHAPAERIEHFIGAGLQAQLAEEVKDSHVDPHGKAIPPKKE